MPRPMTAASSWREPCTHKRATAAAMATWTWTKRRTKQVSVLAAARWSHLLSRQRVGAAVAVTEEQVRLRQHLQHAASDGQEDEEAQLGAVERKATGRVRPNAVQRRGGVREHNPPAAAGVIAEYASNGTHEPAHPQTAPAAVAATPKAAAAARGAVLVAVLFLNRIDQCVHVAAAVVTASVGTAATTASGTNTRKLPTLASAVLAN